MPQDVRDADRRPDPDALIAAAAAEHRGRLKIFLGAAPGVGKTWEMLVQAKRQQDQGVDVLAGVVETHGRAGTVAVLEGLPELPLRSVPYRGQTLKEFDLEAALARRPALLLVDELAHTNAPGSRHAKRWEDVMELVQAGIPVWATLNVQHLESLNDDVAQVTGVRVTETLPDRVLEAADEIELIDLPPAALRARLADGQIYRADNAKRALEGFFKEGNLASLREMALRRAAAHVDEDVRNWMERSGVTGPWPSSARVLALVGPDASAEAVVRQAKRLADALHAPWTMLHIERAGSLPLVRPAIVLASQLGATVDVRVGADLIGTTLDVAQQTHVTHLVVGRGRASFWRRLTGRTLSGTLLRQAHELTLHIIPWPGPTRRRALRSRGTEPWWAWPLAAAGIAATSAAGYEAGAYVPREAMGMVYIAAIVAAASLFGLRLALAVAAASFLAWDFFFLPPLYQFSIGAPSDVIALAVFTFVAILAGALAGRVRGEARAAQARIDGLRRIGAFSRSLGEASTESELMTEIAKQAAGENGSGLVLAPVMAGTDIDIRAGYPQMDTMDDAAWAAARWCWAHQEPAGHGTSTLPGASWRFLPLRTVRGRLGVIGLRAEGKLDEPAEQAFAALADQAAVAWERVMLAQQSARTSAMEETQALRTALLASLGHDLRTPLTGIQGAAGTLRSAWDQLTAETRSDLLTSIEEDVGRMAGFLANITDLTRLESGQITPRLGPVALDEVIDAAAAQLPRGANMVEQVADPVPVALADAALLEQVLVNVLENAVKYSPAGSMIRVRGQAEGGTVTIAVADEGVGIPPDDLQNVFDSFFRAQRGDRVAPGTGLGLAIARGMVVAMAGQITAQSPRADVPADGLPGTVITIRLPVWRE